jgi:calcineurin-like phosphoesterase family protein
MGKCIYCGKYVELPYTCKFCGELFCGDHHLPENHECIELKIWKEQRLRKGYDPIYDIYKDSPSEGFKLRKHKKKIFLISDLHLDHTNIIKYCNRPFKSKYEMNKKILKNWNNKINNSDTVYFLGDLVFGRGSHTVGYWLKRLKGTIILIKGSHDKFKRGRYKNFEILNYRDYEFLLIHNPKYAPKWWRGWIIHGHYHNNYLDNFPFINGIKRTINVSAELLNYTPISIDELLDLDIDNIKKMDTINTTPVLKDRVPIKREKEPFFKFKKPTLPTLSRKKKRKIKRKVRQTSKKIYRLSTNTLKVSIILFLVIGFIQPNFLNQHAPDRIAPYVKKSTDILTDVKEWVIALLHQLKTIAIETKNTHTEIPKELISKLTTPTTSPIPDEVEYLLKHFPATEYNNPYLKAHAKTLTKGCLDNDKACKLFKIYKYIIENFEYRYDASTLYYQTPAQTLEKGYGVCIDFTILFYNYLTASGITTYVVNCPKDSHAYAVACDIDIDTLKKYISNDLRKLSGRYVIPDLEFEVNKVFGRECIHLEGPPKEKDEITMLMDYPGRYVDVYIDPETNEESPLIGKRYAINPITENWDEIEKSEIYVIRKKPFS